MPTLATAQGVLFSRVLLRPLHAVFDLPGSSSDGGAVLLAAARDHAGSRGVGASNLLLDFDFISRVAATGAPRQLEWYAAFGVMVTLVWLYMEVLRLLTKLQGRQR